MSSAIETKALRIRAPNDNGRTAEDFGVRKIDVGTTHAETELTPRADYSGRFVMLKFIGSDGDLCHIALSKTSGREVDSSASETTAGETANVGWPLSHGETVHVQLPDFKTSETLYLIHEGSAEGVLYLQIADGA